MIAPDGDPALPEYERAPAGVHAQELVPPAVEWLAPDGVVAEDVVGDGRCVEGTEGAVTLGTVAMGIVGVGSEGTETVGVGTVTAGVVTTGLVTDGTDTVGMETVRKLAAGLE